MSRTRAGRTKILEKMLILDRTNCGGGVNFGRATGLVLLGDMLDVNLIGISRNENVSPEYRELQVCLYLRRSGRGRNLSVERGECSRANFRYSSCRKAQIGVKDRIVIKDKNFDAEHRY
jgi:hypothetical protein